MEVLFAAFTNYKILTQMWLLVLAPFKGAEVGPVILYSIFSYSLDPFGHSCELV